MAVSIEEKFEPCGSWKLDDLDQDNLAFFKENPLSANRYLDYLKKHSERETDSINYWMFREFLYLIEADESGTPIFLEDESEREDLYEVLGAWFGLTEKGKEYVRKSKAKAF